VTAVSQRPLLLALACLLAPSPAHALLGNISPATPPGWSAPGVPRNTGDATESSALVPAQLLPTQPTFFDWAIGQNAGLSGTWQDELYLDGELLQLVTRSNEVFAARMWYALNTGPSSVAGGRHTLEIWADRLWRTNEDRIFRNDNDWTGQYLWQPQPLAAGAVATTMPPQGEGASPNCNAFAFTRTPGTAWVVSGGGSGDFSLRVFDDYANSTNGLTHEIGRSACPGFVVGSAASAATLYPAILRKPGTPQQVARLAVADAAGRQSASPSASWPSENLPAGMAAQVFEVDLAPGVAETMTLTRFMGQSDLEILVFPPDPPVASPAQAALIGVPRDGDDEYDDLAFAPWPGGRFLVVVARVDDSHLDEACGYSLVLASGGTVDAPAAFAAAPLAASPSPATGPMRLSFALARPAHAELAIYDVAGRAVRRLVSQALPAGPSAHTWDGNDENGRAVAPGRYFVRLVAGSRRENLGVLRVR
jgi:hypothetical protein